MKYCIIIISLHGELKKVSCRLRTLPTPQLDVEIAERRMHEHLSARGWFRDINLFFFVCGWMVFGIQGSRREREREREREMNVPRT